MSAQRFLIIKLVALGDIAVASALLSRIRAEHPDARVTWLCGEGGAPLVRLFPGVAEVLTVNEHRLLRGSLLQRVASVAGVWLQLVRRRFDRVLLVHADRRYRVLAWPVYPAPVTALVHGENPLLDRFRGDEYARLLDGAISRGPIVRRYALADVRPNLPASIPRSSSRQSVILVPGGTRNVLREDTLRRWPIASYRELARRLAAMGREVILVGDAKDAELRPHFQGINVTDRLGSASLVQTLCVLRDADVVVSHDTGPLHFARLVRAPIVAIFGPTDPRNMIGEDPDIAALWGGAHLACRPCYDGRNYAACANNLCVQDVTVDAVVQAVEAHLQVRTQSRPREKGVGVLQQVADRPSA